MKLVKIMLIAMLSLSFGVFADDMNNNVDSDHHVGDHKDEPAELHKEETKKTVIKKKPVARKKSNQRVKKQTKVEVKTETAPNEPTAIN